MDYSLLLVAERLPNASQGSKGLSQRYNYGRNSYLSHDRREAYHFGIIDYLQLWNMSKKGEAWIKHHLKGKNKNFISAVPPDLY